MLNEFAKLLSSTRMSKQRVRVFGRPRGHNRDLRTVAIERACVQEVNAICSPKLPRRELKVLDVRSSLNQHHAPFWWLEREISKEAVGVGLLVVLKAQRRRPRNGPRSELRLISLGT